MPFALTCRAGTLSIDIPFCHGEMTEWPIVPDSKSGVPQGTGGSNPSLSATLKSPQTRVNTGFAGFLFRFFAAS